MKKILAALLATMLIVCAVSCSGKKNDDGDTDTTSGTSTVTNVETEESKPGNATYTFEIKEEINVVDETESGGKSTETLRYPVLTGMKDTEMQSKVNDTFKTIAEEKYVKLVPDVDIYKMEDTIFNYEVTEVEIMYASDSFISVKNSVNLMTALSSYPDKTVYTVNIMLEDGKVLEGDDIYSDFAVITSKFIAGEFKQVYGIDKLMENTSYEDMILQYKSDYANYPETCFTGDSLIINIDLVNALGTSAGFSIPIDKVADCLRFNPVG